VIVLSAGCPWPDAGTTNTANSRMSPNFIFPRMIPPCRLSLAQPSSEFHACPSLPALPFLRNFYLPRPHLHSIVPPLAVVSYSRRGSLSRLFRWSRRTKLTISTGGLHATCGFGCTSVQRCACICLWASHGARSGPGQLHTHHETPYLQRQVDG